MDSFRNTEIAKKFKQLETKNWPLGFFCLRLKTRTENSKPCCTFVRGADRYEVSLRTSYTVSPPPASEIFHRHSYSSQLYRKEHQQTGAMFMPLCRLHSRFSYVNPKQFSICASRQSHVPTSLLLRQLETRDLRSLPTHHSNSFAVLWSEYMSYSKSVISAVLLSCELKLSPVSPISHGYVLLTSLITHWPDN